MTVASDRCSCAAISAFVLPCGGKLGNFQFAWAEAAIIRLCCAVQNGLRCRISDKNLRQKGAEIRCMLGKRQV